MTSEQKTGMKHFIEIEPTEDIQSVRLHKLNGTVIQAGDELIVSVKGQRAQAVLNIQSVHTDRVYQGWAYLHLTGLDDIGKLFTRNLSQSGAEG